MGGNALRQAERAGRRLTRRPSEVPDPRWYRGEWMRLGRTGLDFNKAKQEA